MKPSNTIYYDDKHGESMINIDKATMVRYDITRDVTKVYFEAFNCEYPTRELYDRIYRFINE